MPMDIVINKSQYFLFQEIGSQLGQTLKEIYDLNAV